MEDSIYEIRFAGFDEVNAIIDFYRKYWNPNHALVKSRALFDFQHLVSDYYNIIIAYNKNTGEIDGTWGIIPVAQYDKELTQYGDYWGAILKVRNDVNNKEIHRLVFRFYKYVLNLPGLKSYISSGLGMIGSKFMEPFNRYQGVLNQYYIANNSIESFKIGKNLLKRESNSGDAEIKEINIYEIKERPACTYRPRKSLAYLINRFAEHPIYKYRFWGIYKMDNLLSILVVRIIHAFNEISVIRIVDCLGNLEEIGCIHNQVQLFLHKENAEYVDFLNCGIDENTFYKMGFFKLDFSQNEIIVPNYFEPFERCNVPIHYAYNNEGDYTIFRADSDQDRPNIIHNGK